MLNLYQINGRKYLVFENTLFAEAEVCTGGPIATAEETEEKKSKPGRKPRGGVIKRGKKGKKKVSDEVFKEMLKEVENGRSAVDVCEEFEMKVSAFYARKNYLKKKGGLPKKEENGGGDNKKYNYVCRGCGFKFTSVIPPREIKCPDCKAKPVLDEE